MSTPSRSVTRFAKSIGGSSGRGSECDVGVNSYGAGRRKSTRPAARGLVVRKNARAGGRRDQALAPGAGLLRAARFWNTRRPMSAPLRGVLPVAPTVFHDDESLDLDGQRRVAEFLVDAGAAAICVLANFAEQFSLADDERHQVLDATLDQVAGRVPVIATTSSYSARIARERTLDAQRRGAAVAMLMPPFFGATMAVPEDGVLEFFRRVADGLDIEIMLQDAPLSPTPLPVPLIAR